MGAAVIRGESHRGRLHGARDLAQHTDEEPFHQLVLHDGFIYGLDESILACIDAATGELKWKGGRYGYGQLMLADGHLIVLTEDGDLALVRATPERHEELARFPALDGKTWNPSGDGRRHAAGPQSRGDGGVRSAPDPVSVPRMCAFLPRVCAFFRSTD